MPRISDVVRFLQSHAPLRRAEKWDNVGLLSGDRNAEVSRILTCLTLTPDVAAEAIADNVGLIVTHHPVLFKAVQKLTADDPQGRMLLDLLAHRIAIYSAHTAYDSAEEGINEQLAEMFQLTDVACLRPFSGEGYVQIVVFVPREHLEPVQKALWAAGAGEIGDYTECSYYVAGTGTFRGSESTHPAIGQPGRHEEVAELRLEVRCPRGRVPQAVQELVKAHPYEEPAYFIYPLDYAPDDGGSGRRGRLPQASTLAAFLELTKQTLGVSQLQYAGDLHQKVETVAIACGAGGEFLSDAIRQGCDVLLTGETRFHTLLDARASRTAIVLAGHYATERPGMERLATRLAKEFADVTCVASRVEADPLQWSL